MNHINFNQSVGFPLETEILAEMQKAYKLLNALGAIVGNNTIIKNERCLGFRFFQNLLIKVLQTF